MRLLVITNMFPHTGNPAWGSFVAEQWTSLRAAGVDADIFFIEGHQSRWAYGRAVRDLQPRRKNYDVFHAHHTLAAVPALLAGCRPLVLTVHDNPVVTSRFYRRFAKTVARRADRFVAVSPAAAEALAPVPSITIPMGIDLTIFYPRDQAAARAALGLPPERKFALFPTDPARRSKRYDLARGGVEWARKAEPRLELLIMPRVPRPQVPLYFCAADVILVTSDVELGPLVAKEAVACARPVVSRRVGDTGFLDRCRACIAAEDTAASIGDGILRALTLGPVDPSAVAGYGLDGVARRLIALYQGLSVN